MVTLQQDHKIGFHYYCQIPIDKEVNNKEYFTYILLLCQVNQGRPLECRRKYVQQKPWKNLIELSRHNQAYVVPG